MFPQQRISVELAPGTLPYPMSHPAPSESAVSYRGVTFRYGASPTGVSTDDRPTLENITLDVHAGERLGILGPNGGGKSTLLKLTLGILTGYTGAISILGMTPAEARKRAVIGYVPQRPTVEFGFPVSVRDAVRMGASVGVPSWQALSVETQRSIDDAIDVVGANSFASRPVGKVSGGQFQRAMIARAIARRPRILLLDEPTVGIDPAGQRQFAELLDRLSRDLRLTVIVVSHDIRTVAAGCDRVACLSRTLHFHDAPSGLTPSVLAEVFRHDVAAVFGDVHVDAHAAAACKDPSHHHHTPASAPRHRDGGA